jgi:hypothetical protein
MGLQYMKSSESVNSSNPETVDLSCPANKTALFGVAITQGPVTVHGGSAYPIVEGQSQSAVRWGVDVSGSGSVTLYVSCAYVAN